MWKTGLFFAAPPAGGLLAARRQKLLSGFPDFISQLVIGGTPVIRIFRVLIFFQIIVFFQVAAEYPGIFDRAQICAWIARINGSKERCVICC